MITILSDYLLNSFQFESIVAAVQSNLETYESTTNAMIWGKPLVGCLP